MAGNGGASEKAVEAAVRECTRLLNDEIDGNDAAKEALAAAHDPALGLDRSVCLRDVVEALEGSPAFNCGLYQGYEHPHELVIDYFTEGVPDGS